MELTYDDKSDLINKEIKFIESHFHTRKCFKFCLEKSGSCKCTRSKDDHECEEKEQLKWSYVNNTRLEECVYYGMIKFSGCDDLCNEHKFIRFNVIESDSGDSGSLASIVDDAYRLMDVYWNIAKPNLLISVIGGFKRMDLTNQQKKNFKQGLIDVMKRDKTVIVAGGFNVGVHKLVSETVREYRIHYEGVQSRVHLVGICTWGVVWENGLLGPRNEGKCKNNTFCYPNGISNQKGKVALDPNYDCFLFCDDGTERTYDKEVDFRTKFEKFVAKEAKAFAVQILCEGGYRAVYRAHETLENNISIVVLKGSGRAADLISDVALLRNQNLERNITEILKEYKNLINVQDKDIPSLMKCLTEMREKYSKQIVIYDMFDPNMKFGKMIVKAIIAGQTECSLEAKLRLTIRFNCTDIALTEVFLHPDYSKMDSTFIKNSFIEVLKENKFEFVINFLENDMDIANMVTEDVLTTLYHDSLNRNKCACADLLNELIPSKGKLHFIGKITPILSGNILKNMYSEKNIFIPSITPNLFLWALFSGKIELAEIFWRLGKDHVSSALIGSTILKNMAYYILKRGDSELEKKLSEASTKFEEMGINVLTKAYSENREKTFTILIRKLEMWNNMTCLSIALNGNLLEFLSHTACRSYTTQVWMGGLSPLLSLWKILLSIPFSFCFLYHLIIPSIPRKEVTLEKSQKNSRSQNFQNPDFNILDPENNTVPLKETVRDENITFCPAMKMFYSAPIVKFYINFASYLIFLIIFAYLNLVELKPRSRIIGFKNVLAESFVYLYLVTFIIEEIRQFIDQKRGNFRNKFKAYFSGSCNQLDSFIIFTFLVSIFVRFILPEDLFNICRCMFSVCYCMFCLRTMQFYFAYESVGPKVIMIYDMLRDIIFFLCIFALFIISFGTLSHSMRSPNSPMDIFLIKNIIYMPYFQTYGELMLDKLTEEGSCNSTDCRFQQTTVVIGFAVYLLLTNILLVNLLIAMFGYTFNKIQDQSEKYWLFIRLQLVEEFYRKPILSPPLNVLYYLYKIFVKCFKSVCYIRKGSPSNDDNILLVKNLNGADNIRITGFEQICMETAMDEMTKSSPEYPRCEKGKCYENTRLQGEGGFEIQTREIITKESFS